MYVTPLYTAAAALVFAVLSFRTLIIRQRREISVGHGDDLKLERAIRAHGNFSEYVPLTLLVIFFLEFQGGEKYMVHFFCSCLVAGRIIHATGLSQTNEVVALRVLGMGLTFTALIGASIRLAEMYL